MDPLDSHVLVIGVSSRENNFLCLRPTSGPFKRKDLANTIARLLLILSATVDDTLLDLGTFSDASEPIGR